MHLHSSMRTDILYCYSVQICPCHVNPQVGNFPDVSQPCLFSWPSFFISIPSASRRQSSVLALKVKETEVFHNSCLASCQQGSEVKYLLVILGDK